MTTSRHLAPDRSLSSVPFRAATLLAWLGLVASLVLAIFWVGFLRDALHVGCEDVSIDGGTSLTCRDGNGYLLNALTLTIISVAGAVLRVTAQALFRRRPSATRWALIATTSVEFLAIAATIAIAFQLRISAEYTALLTPLATGIVAALLSISLGPARRAALVTSALAGLCFAAAIIVDYRSAPLAVPGLLHSAICVLDLANARRER